MSALMSISTRLKLARLFVITPADPGTRLTELSRTLTGAGADVLCLEEDLTDTSWSPAKAERGVDDIREGARRAQGLVGYFGREGTAAELAPDVLVLASDGTDPRIARALVGKYTIIGRNCNAIAEVDAALADDEIGFLLVGPGLENMKHAAAVAPQHDPASKPWFATGGVTPATLDAVLRGGAMRVGVGRAITQAADPAAVTTAMKDRLRAAWADDPRMEAVTTSAFGQPANLSFPPQPPAPGAPFNL